MAAGFDWMSVKALARGTVHDTFRVPATYQDNTLDAPVDISVRYHTKIAQTGDLESAGYAEVLVGVDRIIFNRDELSSALVGSPLKLRHKGVVTLTHPKFNGAQFWLETREPIDGPVDEIWNVTRV